MTIARAELFAGLIGGSAFTTAAFMNALHEQGVIDKKQMIAYLKATMNNARAVDAPEELLMDMKHTIHYLETFELPPEERRQSFRVIDESSPDEA